jgi:hypothetical protein
VSVRVPNRLACSGGRIDAPLSDRLRIADEVVVPLSGGEKLTGRVAAFDGAFSIVEADGPHGVRMVRVPTSTIQRAHNVPPAEVLARRPRLAIVSSGRGRPAHE